MNIFELVLSDPSSYQQVKQDYSNHSSNWTHFKQTMNVLFSNTPPTVDSAFFTKSKQLWAHSLKTSPQLITVMINYYQNELDTLVDRSLAQSIKEIAGTFDSNENYLQMELCTYLQTIVNLYSIHEKYLSIFDQEHKYLDLFRSKINTIMEKFNMKAKTFALLKKCYAKDSLNILKSEILQFETDVIDFVKERCGQHEKFNFDTKKIKVLFERLVTLGFGEQYFSEFYDFINKESQIFLTSCTSFTEGKDFMTKCLNFQRSFQKHFIKNIKSQLTEDFFSRFLNSLDDNVYFICSKHCSKHILDIILDFPDSLNIIISLKKCLDKSPLLSEVGEYLNREVEKRLLIPGVITQSILNQYINMLKVLQILDPQGMIFEKITVPIKNYLLKRNDTLRCIISHLTDDIENYSKLTREVVKIPSKEYIEEMSSEQDENAANEWQILPVKQQKLKRRIKYQEIDLVTVLVGLYGSQEAFIGEYQSMMAEKLMSVKNYNIDEQMRNIQLLKMRFGESALQTCNIIVKDVKDSKRNDHIIHSKKSQYKSGIISLEELNCLVVSRGYWPINYENTSTFNLPLQMKQVFEEYAKRFAETKAMRKVYFHYNLGHVNLNLSFENGDFPFKCLPVQAIMICYFDETRMRDPVNGISSQQLSNELQIPQILVKQKMSFWVHKGVVKETRIAKHGLSLRRMASAVEDSEVIYYKTVKVYENIVKDQIDDDLESSLLKQSTSMESHLRHIIQGLIISILNTNGPKSMEKIHLLLKTVYKTDLDYTYGQAQTLQILKKMAQKKKVNFNGEVYSPKQE